MIFQSTCCGIFCGLLADTSKFDGCRPDLWFDCLRLLSESTSNRLVSRDAIQNPIHVTDSSTAVVLYYYAYQYCTEYSAGYSEYMCSTRYSEYTVRSRDYYPQSHQNRKSPHFFILTVGGSICSAQGKEVLTNPEQITRNGFLD